MNLVVVSNRLPIVFESSGDGLKARSGSGGLVAALTPVLRRFAGRWVGWLGTSRRETTPVLLDEARCAGRSLGCEIVPVELDEKEVAGFYNGFSNEIIWPLFHDLQTRCNFVPEYWTTTRRVEQKFADIILREIGADDFLWIHDYHLMGVAKRVHDAGCRRPMSFFLHIPFPPDEIFAKLPWRREVLDGLLAHDLVGFQAPRDLRNFLGCVARFRPEVEIRRDSHQVVCQHPGGLAQLGVFPIGIDDQKLAARAQSTRVTKRVEEIRDLMPGQSILLGVDRLDYTKGIPDRLRAIQRALRTWPHLRGKMTLLQVVVPSRESVAEYQELKARIERLVAQVNGEFTSPGWTPVQYIFRSLEWDELLAFYRAADVALVTPLKDGMNLVAKEYCAAQTEGNGVLILSEFAGAADQLGGHALLVNPFDRVELAEAIRRGVEMPLEDRRRAMFSLKEIITQSNVFNWANQVLGSGGFFSPEQPVVGPTSDDGSDSPFLEMV